MERHADREDACREAERLAAIERQRIRKEAERLAEIQHAENVRAETLRRQHAAWREARQLREFLSAMAAAVDTMAPDGRRDAAVEWLAWCRGYVDNSVNPLNTALAMPAIRRPTWEERIDLENAIVRKLEREWPPSARQLITVVPFACLVKVMDGLGVLPRSTARPSRILRLSRNHLVLRRPQQISRGERMAWRMTLTILTTKQWPSGTLSPNRTPCMWYAVACGLSSGAGYEFDEFMRRAERVRCAVAGRLR
jgi:hypothetical protein